MSRFEYESKYSCEKMYLLTGIFNFHDDNDFVYSCRISNDDGFGHVSCFVVVSNVEQNWEFEEIGFTLFDK